MKRLTLVMLCELVLVTPPFGCSDPEHHSALPPSTDMTAHHRPANKIELPDATALLPRFDARTLLAPSVTPQNRVVSRYCFDAMDMTARANAFAADLHTLWAHVALQQAHNVIIVRAQQGAYALRAKLAPSSDGSCVGATADVSVFKPISGGGGRIGRRRT